jgi:hypothetical protein
VIFWKRCLWSPAPNYRSLLHFVFICDVWSCTGWICNTFKLFIASFS